MSTWKIGAPLFHEQDCDGSTDIVISVAEPTVKQEVENPDFEQNSTEENAPQRKNDASPGSQAIPGAEQSSGSLAPTPRPQTILNYLSSPTPRNLSLISSAAQPAQPPLQAAPLSSNGLVAPCSLDAIVSNVRHAIDQFSPKSSMSYSAAARPPENQQLHTPDLHHRMILNSEQQNQLNHKRLMEDEKRLNLVDVQLDKNKQELCRMWEEIQNEREFHKLEVARLKLKLEEATATSDAEKKSYDEQISRMKQNTEDIQSENEQLKTRFEKETTKKTEHFQILLQSEIQQKTGWQAESQKLQEKLQNIESVLHTEIVLKESLNAEIRDLQMKLQTEIEMKNVLQWQNSSLEMELNAGKEAYAAMQLTINKLQEDLKMGAEMQKQLAAENNVRQIAELEQEKSGLQRMLADFRAIAQKQEDQIAQLERNELEAGKKSKELESIWKQMGQLLTKPPTRAASLAKPSSSTEEAPPIMPESFAACSASSAFEEAAERSRTCPAYKYPEIAVKYLFNPRRTDFPQTCYYGPRVETIKKHLRGCNDDEAREIQGAIDTEQQYQVGKGWINSRTAKRNLDGSSQGSAPKKMST